MVSPSQPPALAESLGSAQSPPPPPSSVAAAAALKLATEGDISRGLEQLRAALRGLQANLASLGATEDLLMATLASSLNLESEQQRAQQQFLAADPT